MDQEDIRASGNNLLGILRADDAALLAPYMRTVSVDAGTVLYDPGDDVRVAHFPTQRCLVSFVVELADGRGIETVLIGREGAVGGIVSHGRLPAFSRCLVQHGGPMLSIASADLELVKSQSATLRHLFARYADCLLAQVFQSVACNAAHSVEQRAAKWLIAAIDRTGETRIVLTQERLASMLGVGRSYLSRLMQMLKARGAITLQRGSVTVLDIDVLGAISCDCNAQVRNHFSGVLAGVYPPASDDGASDRS